ncbi:helix-turn-helix domain-containing protein [Poseidonibacter ostreae]|uniref:helix-turn-helix domain-containing protein n=1 Tax=Poseidonibacter ostreae TaxID=2654171 RepID=UPI00186B0B39|nr:helix-turn-helix domain-containing protein [Poseidonibacter ostreae]
MKLSEQIEDKFTSKLKKEDLTDSEYISRLIENDLDSRIDLGEGFYYNKYLDRLYNQENKVIVLTKIEREIVITLIEYRGELVPVDIITKRSWKKDDVSIYTFRNLIKKIRDKTYFKLIKSRSNLGYSINFEPNEKGLNQVKLK